ncbi:signal protein PDZ [Citricoccus sp. SGAir0253]|uniref:YlbL family protein n=1 Tax=Citricoccus sp. SGAir0253 TaxID=2567881 RepID=UPI0010CD31B2|nr:S16 family serine protease [Citricoccus sp. SGAir0253]QCU77732.1 signal protein PDZ [Citricoccus sp. SGAir0253]
MRETRRPPESPSDVPGTAGAVSIAPAARRARLLRRRRRATTLAGAAAGLLTLTALALPTPYIVESPGPTFNTIGEHDGEPVITVDGAPTYPTTGSLDLTTVYLHGPPTGWTTALDVLGGWVDPTRRIVPGELVYPSGTTADEVDAENSQAMATSQDWAVAAALEELGIDYGQELSVAGFAPDSRATDVLREHDRLVSAAGEPVTGLEGLKDRLAASGGRPVELGIVRDGRRLTVQAPVYAGPDGSWLLGIYLDSAFRFPVDVRIALENVGGPSAGMMFALGIIDEMTPGALTGGQHIAGTGTIDPDGTVGEIGGIVQKVAGAREAGAEHFLAPAGNCAALAGHVPDGIDAYSVATLDEARAAVEALAQGRSPRAPTCG